MISLCLGDILKSRAEVIVNPANSHLWHGGGLARRIADAANRKRFMETLRRPNTFDDECQRAPIIATGHAYDTSAGALPFKAVIHAVGPTWTAQEAHKAERLVEAAYLSSLDLARFNDWRHIAFPAISSGIYGVPINVVARGAVSAMSRRNAFGEDFDVEIWLWTAEHANQFSRAFGQRVKVVT